MENATAETAETLVKDVERLKQDVAKLTADVKAHGQARVDDVRQRVNEAVANTRAQLVAHPFAVLGFGLVLGFLFGRRRRRRFQG